MQYFVLLSLLLLLSCKSEQFKVDNWCCAELRVLHLGSITPPVKIELSYFKTSVILADCLAYTQSVPQFEHLKLDASIPSNEQVYSAYRFSAIPIASQNSASLASSSFQFLNGLPYTVVLCDTGLLPSWIQLIDRAPPVGPADTSSVYIRLVNLSNVQGASLAIGNRVTEITRPYTASPWLRLPAGNQRFEVRDAQQNVIRTEPNNPILLPRRVYQAYFNLDTLILVSDRFR
jgi:hypothetical protein